MKAKEILLALLIIAVGVTAHYVNSGKLGSFFDGEPFFFMGGEEFVFEESLDIPGPLPERLEVDNAHGGVDLRSGAADRITVHFRKSIVRRTKAEAQAVADRLKMTVDRAGGRLILGTNRDTFKKTGFETFFTVTIPAGSAIRVRNSYGPVRIADAGETTIENPHGEVTAEGIAGPLVLSNSYEAVIVRSAAAGVSLNCPHSDLTIETVRGGASIVHNYGEVTLRDVDGSVVVRGAHSRITGTSLPGTIEIGSSYEDISLTETGSVTIRGPHCGIVILKAAGAVDISGPYSRIEARGVVGNLKIDAPNSEVAASDVKAEVIDIATTNQNIGLAGFTGRARIRMAHGELALEPLDISGPIDVEATYAEIHLTWPAGVRAPFEGVSRGGRVFWNLPERPDVDESNGQSLVKAFQAEAGRPGIRLTTSYGDIRVEKR